MPKIKTLTIREFRGIRDATLPIDGKSVVILGENGTGKSSIVDALEFFYAGQVGHLQGAQSVSTSRHAPHIRARPGSTSIEITFERVSAALLRTFDNAPAIPIDLQQYFSLGSRSTFILRRRNILDFILAQPADRYEQLAAIIGVDDLDTTERALMQTRDDVLAQRDSLGGQIRDAEQRLKNLVGDVVKDDLQLLAVLNQKLNSLKQEPLAMISEIGARKVATVAASRRPEETQKASTLQGVIGSIGNVRARARFFDSHGGLWTALDDLQKNRDHLREVLFHELLVVGQRLISEQALDYCPVCLRPVDRDELLASVEKRIQSAAEIAHKASLIRQLGSALSDDAKRQREAVERLLSQVTECGIPFDRIIADQYLALLGKLLNALEVEPTAMQLLPLTGLQQASEVELFMRWLDEVSASLQAESQKLLPTEQDKATVDVIDLLSSVNDCWQALTQLRAKFGPKAACCDEIAAVYDCFVNTKRSEVQSIYRELEDDIKRYFQVLHQNEGYHGLKLNVNEGRRASTEIKMDFHDKPQEDPRAFNSEGHLDSLGLCVFLAFVKRFNSDFPLIALDDVVSSIDGRHRSHICELLFAEFPQYQLFITTHDEIWFRELCSHQRAFSQPDRFLNLHILRWTLDEGPFLDRYIQPRERTDEKLRNADKAGAANDARTALEGFLREICIATQTAVVLKRDPEYTVSELQDPFVSRIRELAPSVYLGNETVFRKVQADGIFGNMLSHANTYAANASMDEVTNFVQAVRNFEDLFTCPSCGHIVEYIKPARLLKCRCREGGIVWQARG